MKMTKKQKPTSFICNVNLNQNEESQILPLSNGSFCNSLFLGMLKRDDDCRLSFFIRGAPGPNFILLICVGGGTPSLVVAAEPTGPSLPPPAGGFCLSSSFCSCCCCGSCCCCCCCCGGCCCDCGCCC